MGKIKLQKWGFFNCKKHKTRECKIYPLSTAATNVLKDIKKECDYVFSYKANALTI